MLLFEAKEEIDRSMKFYRGDSRTTLLIDTEKHAEALEIASKCIQAQMELADILNDFTAAGPENDTFSGQFVCEMLDSVRFDRVEEEDGED